MRPEARPNEKRRCAPVKTGRAAALHHQEIGRLLTEGALPPAAARGTIGIVAGRLKEKSGKPAIVVALGEDGRWELYGEGGNILVNTGRTMPPITQAVARPWCAASTASRAAKR